MSKSLIFEDKARKALADGVSKTARAVGVTMGPKGRNVVLEKDFGAPAIINDGVSIAKEVELKDPYENLGAQLVKEVANNTNDGAGDGTTTATVLMDNILQAGLKHINAGVSAVEIKRGMDKAVKAVVNNLKDISVEIKDRKEIEQVATVSANNDSYIGSLIADAMSKVGKEGVVTIEESKGTDTNVETTDGMQFDQGYTSPHFANKKDTLEAIHENAHVLVCEDKIESVKDAVELLTTLAENIQGPVVFIADSFSNDVLTLLVVNYLKGAINVVAVKAPGFGENRKEMLEDISILTGATKISATTGNPLSEFNAEMLGSARRIVVTKDNTTITEGAGDTTKLEERVSQIKAQREESESDYDKGKLQS
jgi:chaperonin GroEL